MSTPRATRASRACCTSSSACAGLGLTGQLPQAAAADYLSGLLIGHELRAGVPTLAPAQPLALVGEPALCARYAQALGRFGVHGARLLANTAPAGLWRLACEIGQAR